MTLRALAGLLLANVTLAAATAAGAAPTPEPDRVTCANRDGRHMVSVRLRDQENNLGFPPGLSIDDDLFGFLRDPAVVEIQRRIDEVTLIDRTDPDSPGIEFSPTPAEALEACGPAPTVANTDSIRVRLGKHSEIGELHLNGRYGALAPGFTDEGDGSSEIELEARLGSGSAIIEMTRGADTVALARPAAEPGPFLVNLNAGEPNPDFDVTVGSHAGIVIAGGGSADMLTASGLGPEEPARLDLTVMLVGGQGADSISTGNGSEVLFGGQGPDQVEAGGGRDFVIAYGRAPDRIDCGPGKDLVLVARDDNRLQRCERIYDQDELFDRPTPRKILNGKSVAGMLRRR